MRSSYKQDTTARPIQSYHHHIPHTWLSLNKPMNKIESYTLPRHFLSGPSAPEWFNYPSYEPNILIPNPFGFFSSLAYQRSLLSLTLCNPLSSWCYIRFSAVVLFVVLLISLPLCLASHCSAPSLSHGSSTNTITWKHLHQSLSNTESREINKRIPYLNYFTKKSGLEGWLFPGFPTFSLPTKHNKI